MASTDDIENEFNATGDGYLEDPSFLEGPGHLLGITFVDLVNELNLAYTGPVYFGTPL